MYCVSIVWCSYFLSQKNSNLLKAIFNVCPLHQGMALHLQCSDKLILFSVVLCLWWPKSIRMDKYLGPATHGSIANSSQWARSLIFKALLRSLDSVMPGRVGLSGTESP